MNGFYQVSLYLVKMTKRVRSTRITLRIEVVGVEIRVFEPPTNFFWDRDRRGTELGKRGAGAMGERKMKPFKTNTTTEDVDCLSGGEKG